MANEEHVSEDWDAIRATLRATGGNKAQTARLLKTDYKTLHVKMKQLGLRARDYAR